MSSSKYKVMQVAAIVGIASFIALGSTFVQRTVRQVLHNAQGDLTAKGPQAKSTRSVRDFDRVEAGQIYQVDVSFGSTPSVTLEAPSDLLPHLTTEVRDGTLSLGSNIQYNIRDNAQIKAHVVVKRLSGVSISGAGTMVVHGRVEGSKFVAEADGASTLRFSANVGDMKLVASGASKATIDSLSSRSLSVEATGAASCLINGTVDTTDVQVEGAGNLKGKLTAGKAKVRAEGASHAAIRVTGSFDGEASGASSITYSGNPAQKHVQSSGVGSVSNSD
jgi:hypothetical protein